MEGVRDGAAEEDWRWDLNPGVAAMLGLGPCSFGVLLFATCLRKQERSYWEEKG